MFYPELLSTIYANFNKFLMEWERSLEGSPQIGALVFEPSDYLEASLMDEVKHKYWTADQIQAYLRSGGKESDGWMDLLGNFEFGEEFLVMIVENVAGSEKRAVHIHKITRVGLN